MASFRDMHCLMNAFAKLFGLCILLCFGQQAWGQTPKGNDVPPAVVHVIDAESQEAIGGARVCVWERRGSPLIDETTASDGTLRLHLAPMEYHLRVDASGFFEKHVHLELGAGEAYSIAVEPDWPLRRKRSAMVRKLALATGLYAGLITVSALDRDNTGGRAIAIVAAAPGGALYAALGIGLYESLWRTNVGIPGLVIPILVGAIAGPILATLATREAGWSRPATTFVGVLPLLAVQISFMEWHRRPDGSLPL